MLEELSEEEADMLAEVGNIGAGHASNALSQLLSREIKISVPSASIVSVTELSEKMDYGDEMVVGLYVPISGDIEGGVLLLIPHRNALQLSDMMTGRDIGSTSKLSDMDRSSLKELGNILVGNCLTALSTFLEMEFEEHVPEIATGSGMAVLDSIAVEYGSNFDRALEINEVLRVGEEIKIPVQEGKKSEIKSDFFMLFNLEDAEKFMDSLKDKIM